ncbi:hypothetical protein D1872_247070 [compost metagenome]
MPVQGLIAIAMINDNYIAIAVLLTCKGHDTFIRGFNITASSHVDPLMHSTPAAAIAARQDCTGYRPYKLSCSFTYNLGSFEYDLRDRFLDHLLTEPFFFNNLAIFLRNLEVHLLQPTLAWAYDLGGTGLELITLTSDDRRLNRDLLHDLLHSSYS